VADPAVLTAKNRSGPHRLAGLDQGGEVHAGVEPPSATTGRSRRVGDVGLDEGRAVGHGVAVPGAEVVDDGHLVAGVEQRAAVVAPMKPAPPVTRTRTSVLRSRPRSVGPWAGTRRAALSIAYSMLR
jgi:hypothetical protein